MRAFRILLLAGVALSASALAAAAGNLIVSANDGKLAIVDGTNKAKDSPFRAETGKLFLYAIRDGKAEKLGEAASGKNAQGAVFTPDGKHVVVQNYVEKELALYRVTGVGIEKAEARIPIPGFPASLRRAP